MTDAWAACALVALAVILALSVGWPFVDHIAACAQRWWD